MFLDGQLTSKGGRACDLGLCKFCGVLPCLSYELLATPQGACTVRKRPAKYGQEKNQLQHILSNHDDTREQLFPSFPVVKQEHVEGNTGCIGFLSVMVIIANF